MDTEYLNEYQKLALETLRQDEPKLTLDEYVMLQACFSIEVAISSLIQYLDLFDTQPLRPVHFTMMGLIGESGELIDLLKKKIFHKHDTGIDNLVDELGDVYWYLATTADKAGYTMDEMKHMGDTTTIALMGIWNALGVIVAVNDLSIKDVLARNVEKLHVERYPDGFEFGGGRDRE